MSIGAGLIIPQLIRWYWWRLNGYGYAIGMASGMLAAIIWKLVTPEGTEEYFAFIFAAVISLIGTIIGTLLTTPTDNKVLENFYRVTRPFGFWNPIRRRLSPQFITQVNAENRRDIFSTFIAVPWQVCLFMMWMVLVMKRLDTFVVLLSIVLLLSVILYFSWFRYLSTEVVASSEVKNESNT